MEHAGQPALQIFDTAVILAIEEARPQDRLKNQVAYY